MVGAEQGRTERRFLGLVEVDSGTVLLGDPLYCLPHAGEGRPGIEYEAVITAPTALAGRLDDRPVLLLGRFGGDGTFPVFGAVDEYGELVSVTIEFVGPDEEGE